MTAAADTAQFAIDLRDDMSPAAQSAGKALGDLKKRMDDDLRVLRQMQAAMARLKGGTFTNVREFRRLRDAITAQKQGLAQAQARYLSLGGTFDEVAAASGSAAGGFTSLFEAAQSTPGPLGAMASRLGTLRGLVAGGPLVAGALALAAAMIAIVAASAALVGAVAAATAQLLRYGVAQAGARRSELLRLEGLMRIRSWYGLAAGSASELQAAIDRVSDSTASGRDEVGQYAQQLYRMGLRGGALEEALEGMAIAGSAGGERLARRFAGLAVGAARMGRSVRAVADDFRARFGPIAAAQALSLDRQMLQLRQNVARIFDGLKLEPFLRGLRSVTSLFSQSTASGRALRRLVERLLSPLLDQAPNAGMVMRRFIQGMILGAQRLTLVYLRLRNRIRAAFGGADVLGSIDRQQAALTLGTVAVGLFVTSLIVAATVLAALAAPFALAFAAGFAFVTMLRRLHHEVSRLLAIGKALGQALVVGLVGGLASGRDLVIGRVRALAASATSAFRDALQIRSPSRVFASLGVQISRGVAEGVDDGAPSAAGAVERIVDVPTGGAGGARGGSRVAVSIGAVYVQAGQTSDPRELARAFRDELVRELEGVGIELGAPA